MATGVWWVWQPSEYSCLPALRTHSGISAIPENYAGYHFLKVLWMVLSRYLAVSSSDTNWDLYELCETASLLPFCRIHLYCQVFRVFETHAVNVQHFGRCDVRMTVLEEHVCSGHSLDVKKQFNMVLSVYFDVSTFAISMTLNVSGSCWKTLVSSPVSTFLKISCAFSSVSGRADQM